MKSGAVTIVGFDPGSFQTAVAGSNGCLGLERSCVTPTSRSNSSVRDPAVGCHSSERQSLVEPFAGGRFLFVRPDCASVDFEQARSSARRLAQFAISRIVPQSEGPLLGVIPLPSRASEFNRRFVADSVKGVFDACLYVPSPLAIAYGLGHLKRTLVVDVGAGTVDISLIDDGLPGILDQVTLPVGLARTDRAFQQRVQARHGLELTLDESRRIRELYGAVCGDVSGAAVTGQDGVRRDVSQCLAQACGELKLSITTALSELAHGGSLKPETVILTGGGSRLIGLSSVISGLIPDSELIVPRAPALSAATGALCMGRGLTPESWRQLEFTAIDEPEKSARSAA